MIPELGQFALVLSAVIALFLGAVPLAGTLRHNVVWQSLARPAALLQFVLVSFAFACLASSFLSNDFSVKYVAEHSNTLLPKPYQFAAVWGGHEGSLLLWVLMLSGWTAAVAIFSASLPLAMVARVLGVLGLVSVGFLMFILTTSNPFDRLFPMPADGRDLNPLLQDPGLVIHPPMLYMGYVGMSVTFAFAIAALDRHCVGLSHLWHWFGFLVGLLRVGLGWMVVLGPRGKRVPHALVGRHRAYSFFDGH